MNKIRISVWLIWAFCIITDKNPAIADESKAYNIVFIGNSITYGALHEQREKTAPPAQAAEWLKRQKEIDTLYIANQGRSGKTTTDFLPASKSYFPKVKKAAADLVARHPEAPLIFSIMLGTNDSAVRTTNPPTSPEQYIDNMCTIIDSLLTLYPTAHIILNRIIYYSPNTHTARGSSFLQDGLKRIDSYYKTLPHIVKHFESRYPGQVTIGDTKAYRHFKKKHKKEMYAEEGKQGIYYLHPNPRGAKALGAYWGKAIYRHIKRTASREAL